MTSTSSPLPRTPKPDTLGATLKLHAELQRKSAAAATSGTAKRRSARQQAKSASSSTSSSSSGEDEGVSVASAGNVSAADVDQGYPVYDSRHPTYLGDWPKSVPNVHDDIAIDDMDEPHLKRKHALLDRHPEITQLYGHEWRTKYITLLLVSIQVAFAYAFGAGPLKDAHWGWLVLTSYVFGGTITAMFGVLVHECAHNLAFKAHFPNRILGLVANIGIVFPISASFRRYHLEHHTFQGVHGKDPDLPLEAEWKLVRGNKVLKFLWIFCFPFLYVFRGAVMMKKPQTWELINWAWTITTDALVYTYCGPKGLVYLFLSLWFGYGIHPGAMHFIQEHYTFEDGQETYSYYGSFNWLFMNIGYHNEHHDVTKVAWSKLPEVRRIAPELYDSIAYHTSWWKILYDFIMLDHIGPQSRLGRDFEDHKAGRATIATARAIQQRRST